MKPQMGLENKKMHKCFFYNKNGEAKNLRLTNGQVSITKLLANLIKKAQLMEIEEIILDEFQLCDFLLIDIDISKEEATLLRLPIRVGFNGELIVWCDDMDPK